MLLQILKEFQNSQKLICFKINVNEQRSNCVGDVEDNSLLLHICKSSVAIIITPTPTWPNATHI